VTAEGELLTASADEHPDLLWALRGGGGNFGVVLSFELALHPVGDVVGGMILQPLDRAEEVLRGWRDVMADAPDALGSVLSFVTVPPSPDLPGWLHGRRVLAVGVCVAGTPPQAQRALEPLRRLGAPLLERIAVLPYALRQRLQDPSAPAGLHNHWRSDHLAGLGDDVAAVLAGHARAMTSPLSQLHVYALGGAMGRLPPDATAYAHRAAPFLASGAALWTGPDEDPAPHVAWAHGLSRALRPYAAGTYVNFLDDEGDTRVRDAYGPEKHARLAAVKRAYDPANVFRINHNIEPTP
jgi:FAD/FMN-containing dehydrogenase